MSAHRLQALAHDMRAPLGAIAALAELLQAHAGEAETTRRCALQLHEACEELLALAQELADGEQPRSIAVPCTARALAGGAAALFGERITLRFSGDCTAPVLADERAVRRILLNLLANAVKFTPEDGEITLAVAARRARGLCHLRFAVRDTGIGMGEETLSRLFTPYARGREAQEAGVPGTGLGLYASREMARAMGGEITARSRPGAGSEFVFSVSLAEDGAKALAGLRLLVAEDNALARDALCELLESHGAQPVPAADGHEAVALFESGGVHAFDAVLMDMLLPGLDGCAAAGAIRRLPRADAAAVPILALTGMDMAAAQAKALESGMNACVRKPVSMKELACLLARAKALR